LPVDTPRAPAAALGFDPGGFAPGARADLVALEAGSTAEAVAAHPAACSSSRPGGRVDRRERPGPGLDRRTGVQQRLLPEAPADQLNPDGQPVRHAGRHGKTREPDERKRHLRPLCGEHLARAVAAGEVGVLSKACSAETGSRILE
jgi:hypothetical protein